MSSSLVAFASHGISFHIPNNLGLDLVILGAIGFGLYLFDLFYPGVTKVKKAIFAIVLFVTLLWILSEFGIIPKF